MMDEQKRAQIDRKVVLSRLRRDFRYSNISEIKRDLSRQARELGLTETEFVEWLEINFKEISDIQEKELGELRETVSRKAAIDRMRA